MRRTIVAACLCALALADVARGEVVARLPNESEIRAYGGVAVVSVAVRAHGPYRLSRVHRDGRVVPLPGVPADSGPFDADVGPDSHGRPIVVYSRCEPPSCDLWLHRIGRHGEERIRTASTREWDETEPTVWRGRIVWQAEHGKRHAILTRDRLAARTIRSRPLRGGGDFAVEALEVRGRDVAAITSEDDRPEIEVSSLFALRLYDLDRPRARPRVLRRAGGGLSGTVIVGPTFAGHRLGWLVACFGDPSGCTRVGPSTYDLRTGRTTTERGYRARTGYAFVRGGTLEVDGGEGVELGEEDESVEDPETFDSPCAEDGQDDRATCAVVFRRRR